MCSVQFAVCCVQLTVCYVQCAVCSVPCTVYSVQCAVCCVQCAVCSVQHSANAGCAVRQLAHNGPRRAGTASAIRHCIHCTAVNCTSLHNSRVHRAVPRHGTPLGREGRLGHFWQWGRPAVAIYTTSPGQSPAQRFHLYQFSRIFHIVNLLPMCNDCT